MPKGPIRCACGRFARSTASASVASRTRQWFRSNLGDFGAGVFPDPVVVLVSIYQDAGYQDAGSPSEEL